MLQVLLLTDQTLFGQITPTIASDEKTGYHSYIPYPYVSEDDVLWVKRVRKFIDIRITQNHPLYFPISVAYSDYNGWDGTSMERGQVDKKYSTKHYSRN